MSDNLSTTPHSLHKLPNANAPRSGQASGKNITHNDKQTRGKTIFSRLETSLIVSFVFFFLRQLLKVS